MSCRKLQPRPLKKHQEAMLRLRGKNPKNYVVLKDTFTSLYLRDLRDGSVLILYKRTCP